MWPDVARRLRTLAPMLAPGDPLSKAKIPENRTQGRAPPLGHDGPAASRNFRLRRSRLAAATHPGPRARAGQIASALTSTRAAADLRGRGVEDISDRDVARMPGWLLDHPKAITPLRLRRRLLRREAGPHTRPQGSQARPPSTVTSAVPGSLPALPGQERDVLSAPAKRKRAAWAGDRRTRQRRHVTLAA
jgi:hypothetical protein